MIWSCDTCQRIPCFDSCQLIITWKSNIHDVPMVMVLLSYFSRYGTSRTDGHTYRRTESHVTTKILRSLGYQIFLRYGAPLACLQYTRGVFHLQKSSKIFHWEFPLRKARSICHKSHSREARPLNRPRKAWNW